MITRGVCKKVVTAPISALGFLLALVLIAAAMPADAVEITDITVNVTP